MSALIALVLNLAMASTLIGVELVNLPYRDNLIIVQEHWWGRGDENLVSCSLIYNFHP